MTFWQSDSSPAHQTSDLDRSIALGIRSASSPPASPSPNSLDRGTDRSPLSGLRLRRREEIISGYTHPESDDSSPPIINIFAENYRFKLAERLHGPKPVERPMSAPKALVPILIPYSPDHPRAPQNERRVHFFPEKDDVVPRHAQIFDIDQAIFEYNERIAERQMYALFHAQMLCEPPPSTNTRFSNAQRIVNKNVYGDQQIRNQRSQPRNQRRNQRGRPATAEFQENDVQGLADTLTISKFELPSPRRPSSQKTPIVRKNPTNFTSSREVQVSRNSPPHKRYRSPPPRAFREPRDVSKNRGNHHIYDDF